MESNVEVIRSRYLKIIWFFGRAFLAVGFWDLILPRIGLGLLSRRTRDKRLFLIASNFRILAIEMGGVMIKVGQFLSTRVDVLPDVITEELTGLQDEVPAESYEDILQVAENDLGSPLSSRFETFEQEPIAAASLGQVHQARLLKNSSYQNEENFLPPEQSDQRNVVVKIQRPNIEKIIHTDLAALSTVGEWLKRYRPIRRRVNVDALLAEFSRILYLEIDYINEGKNCEILSENFKDESGVLIPKVIWEHTTKRVLTLEDVSGIKISDYQSIDRIGIDRREVARNLLNLYFKQIFEDGFFHADPHPGNIFLKPIDTEKPGSVSFQVTLVDFGMVGRITPEIQHGLREMLIAIGTRDSNRLIHSYQLLDILLPNADLTRLRKADEWAFNQFWGKNMSELRDISTDEIRQYMSEFRDLIFDMPFQVPHDLIFLARAVGLLSGLCTGLDAEFNVWEQMTPYAKRLIRKENLPDFLSGLPEEMATWVSELGSIIQKLVVVPGRVEGLLSKVEQGELNVQDPVLTEQVKKLTRSINFVGGGIIFAVLLVSAVLLYLNGEFGLSIGFAVMGLVSILIAIRPVR